METNGKEFAYITEKGVKNIFPNTSLAEEIKDAWSYYDYENKKAKDVWIPFEISKDKN